MSYKEWQPILFEELKQFMATVPQKSPAHDIDHILRVWRMAETLGKKLKADMEVLVAAVFLHDFGRHFGQEVHGELGAEKAEPALKRIGFPEQKIPAVLDAIRFHEYFVPEEKRETIEAKILSDVDRIDALGYIGIMRHLVFYYYEKKKPIKEIIEMINKRWASVKLGESKKIGKKYYLIALNYFKELEKEMAVE